MTTSFNAIVTKYGPTYYIVQPDPKAKKLLYCPHDDPMMIMMTDIWTLYEDKKHHMLFVIHHNVYHKLYYSTYSQKSIVSKCNVYAIQTQLNRFSTLFFSTLYLQ